MRMTSSLRKWLGNTAVLVIASLLFSVVGNGLAMAQSTGTLSQPSATVQALTQASGATSAATTISFEVTPTTPSFSGVWVDIFGPNGHDRSNGPQQVTPSVYGGVYSVVYTAYLNVIGRLSSIPSVVYGVYNTLGGVLYNVYLKVSTPPPNNSTGTTTTTSSSGTSSTGTPVASVFGALGTRTFSVNGLAIPAAHVTVDINSVTQGLANLPSTQQNLEISVPASSIPAGGVVQVTLPTQALNAVGQAKKNLEISTPEGSMTLPPAILAQLAAQVPSGDHVTITIRPTLYSTVQNILAQTGPGSSLQSAGTIMDFAVSVTNPSGQTVGTFEPSNGTCPDLTVPYNSSSYTGPNALKLGLYRWSITQKTWLYMGGSTNVTSGTLTAPVCHLSTYGVFEDTQTFPDILGFWAQADIELMVAHHVVNGVSSTSFAPNENVTRAQFATMIARALNLDTTNTNAPFSDVSSSAYYAGPVAAAAKAGIIKGYPNGTFAPNANITREEMAAMIVRAMAAAGQPSTITAQQIAKVLSPFTDQGKVESWATTDMAIAVEQGIVNGMTPSTLVPGAPATRAQAAVMIKRLLGYLGDL